MRRRSGLRCVGVLGVWAEGLQLGILDSGLGGSQEISQGL